MSQDRVALIRERLQSALAPESMEVIDDSHLHAGHAGAEGGMGHFSVTIVSEKFVGRSAVERHRMIYAALGDAMQTDIHALSIDAYAPDEI